MNRMPELLRKVLKHVQVQVLLEQGGVGAWDGIRVHASCGLLGLNEGVLVSKSQMSIMGPIWLWKYTYRHIDIFASEIHAYISLCLVCLDEHILLGSSVKKLLGFKSFVHLLFKASFVFFLFTSTVLYIKRAAVFIFSSGMNAVGLRKPQ